MSTLKAVRLHSSPSMQPTLRAASLGAKPILNRTRYIVSGNALPGSLPLDKVAEIEEPSAREALNTMEFVSLTVEGLGRVDTAYVARRGFQSSINEIDDRPAFVLLHGFDSSLLEYRRLIPLLSELGDVYAVDLAGWGFTDLGFAENPDIKLGPTQKRAHLQTFCQKVLGRPATLIGSSLGGSVAIDFAVEHPEWVNRLVLVDAQGFIDGIGPMATMPRFLSVLGVQILKSVPLRQMANQMAYYDKKRFATDDAMRVGRLHTFMPGWLNANVAFMGSGGYSSQSSRMGQIQCPTLVVWGRQDEILSPSYAEAFLKALPDARLAWIEECGHIPALEQPQALVNAIKEFVSTAAPVKKPVEAS